MSNFIPRRRFLQGAAAGGVLAGLGDLSFLSRLPAVSAADSALDTKLVRLAADIEPTVRLLEETPRDRLLEEVAHRVKNGLNYRELLAALLLAGVRNVQPRPSVGFKFHAVLVVNSAHLASLSSPDEHRWLPIFWSLDYFKSSQAATARESGWRMAPVDESKVPPAHKARQAFIDAMDKWDEGAADAAVAGLARTAGAAEVFELMWRYGARDFRSIGHKAIFVANSWRTLQCVGWQHAEPVLRSLAYALLNHEGDKGKPSDNDFAADRPWRKNDELAKTLRPEWREGEYKPDATAQMLEALRGGSESDAPAKAVELLNGGASPQSVWNAILAAAGELPMRKAGIVALHAVTSTNALRYAYDAAGDDDTRRMMLLQNASFVPLFRKALGDAPQNRIDGIEPQPPKEGADSPKALEEIFADVSQDRMAATRKALAFLQANANPKPLIDAARLTVFLKGNDSHDYKYSSALLEDWAHLKSPWRERYLAAGMFLLTGSQEPDNKLVQRTRAALGA
ncbi:MAG TPA: hypothetical protein VFB66_32445 [Tepidisphaeraceae bacterium]|nr:hypothetical protein [Tepidisphaeraceae bacterium]